MNEISERLNVSQYNVSKHLRVMGEAGLLESKDWGKHRHHDVAKNPKSAVAKDKILDLDCRTFRLDQLPKQPRFKFSESF